MSSVLGLTEPEVATLSRALVLCWFVLLLLFFFFSFSHLISSVNQFCLQTGLPHGANTIAVAPGITYRYNGVLRRKGKRVKAKSSL